MIFLICHGRNDSQFLKIAINDSQSFSTGTGPTTLVHEGFKEDTKGICSWKYDKTRKYNPFMYRTSHVVESMKNVKRCEKIRSAPSSVELGKVICLPPEHEVRAYPENERWTW